MLKVNLNELELTEFTAKEAPGQHCYATFPMFGAHGTEHSATVYFELEPGDNLGRHTDSAEELLLVLEGEIEAIVEDEAVTVSKGELIQVPEMAPHDFKNIGSTRAKILGFFGVNHFVATFDETWLPTESNVVDTSKMIN